MTSVNQIRRTFLQFFEKASHTIVPSSPLIPHNDPTLMFTNAGMVQFKNVFTGAERLKFTKAASSQKCVRAGGKHNDLDNVGYTARHHTFFEMLGNFSFGDYFKETAIELAWNFLTKEVGLPKEKLYVTVYHTDEEAYQLWQKIASLSSDKIIRISTADNFWMMGETGPCGPCSEIFYDHGSHIPGGLPGTPEQDGDRFIEIWNLVFMQYEQLAQGERIALPKPSIDTGMGLERIAAVLQGVHDNYDIDLFKHLITASEDISGRKDSREQHISHRIIADHLRSSSFLIADGVLPSNEGRGYVLRRIMRRAMRHAHQLGCKEPLLHRLVPTLIAEMGDAYPELGRAEAVIRETLKLEEERFKETLGRGLKLLESETATLQAGQKLSGDIAFKLYDTYGFPLDLTKDILKQKRLEVDEDTFEQAMQKQREMARASWVGSGEKATQDIWFDIREAHGATEFMGYEHTEAQGQVVALVVEGKKLDKVTAPGSLFSLVVNQTPFYGESGGQMGDHGQMVANTMKLIVHDTKKMVGDLIVHMVELLEGTIAVGDEVTLAIDEVRRTKLRANHSATHLLHAVLRDVLGAHVTQKGSLVAEDRLRFDFSHAKALSPEEVRTIETRVNQMIRSNNNASTSLMTPQKAIESGAMALFGEKYGEEVRVVMIGDSVELCGGTHVRATGDIGVFKILSESAIAAGVRRIEACTGEAALAHIAEEEAILSQLTSLLKVSTADVSARVAQLLEDKKRLEKEVSEAKKKALTGGAGGALEKEQINGVAFLGKVLEEVPAKDLRGIVETFKQQLGSGVVAVVSLTEGKASLVVGVTDDLKATHDAVTLVKAGAAALGGSGGGGKAELAQAGGPDGSKAKEAVDAVRQLLA